VSNLRFDLTGPYEVEHEDLVYARPQGLALEARLYRPRGAGPGPRPAFVDVHGGAWSHFDRRADAHFDRALAASGAVVLALDFRQGAEHRWPASLCDVLAGVRFLRAHAAKFEVSEEQIGLVGGSSGGHLCLVAALCPETAAFLGTPIEGADAASISARTAFVLALWPIADPLARYRYLEPLLSESDAERGPSFRPDLLRSSQQGHFGDEANMDRASVVRILREKEFQALPPIWVAHPELDRNVTLEMSQALVDAYRAAGGPAELEVFPEVGHGFANFPGPVAAPCIARMRAVTGSWLEAQNR
jgi:acetyl esterase/lipase